MFQNVIRNLSRVNSALSYKFLTPQLKGIPNICQQPNFHSLTKCVSSSLPVLSLGESKHSSLIKSQSILTDQVRSKSNFTVIKYSREKGQRLSDREISKRFFRLDWGMWIHTKCGRHKKMWKKSFKQKRRLRYHVMCNATQCTLLDKMVNNVFKQKRYFVDDPYEPYHFREEFYLTRSKPRPLPESADGIVDTSP